MAGSRVRTNQPIVTDAPRAATAVDQTIGARIRARRLAIGMSQEKLADEIGVTFQQVQKYEKGINRVAAATLLRIAAALEASVLEFLPLSSLSLPPRAAQVHELAALAEQLPAEDLKRLLSFATGLAATAGAEKSGR